MRHVEAFRKQHENAINLHIEHERIVAIERRELRTPHQVLDAALKKAQKIGVPQTFARAVRKRKYKGAYYLLGEPGLREIASDYFSRKL